MPTYNPIRPTAKEFDEVSSQLDDIMVNAKDFIQSGDNGDLSLAVQRAIDSVGNAVTNGAEILLPRGQWDWKTPVVINQKDGLTIKGAGRWATRLIAKSTLQFVDDLGLVDDYNTNAYFIVTRRRVTGIGAGGTDPAGVDSHARHLKFEGFSFHGQYNDGVTDYSKTINGIFTHGMSHCYFMDIYGEYLKYGVDFGTYGVYRCKAIHGEWSNCINGFKNVKGTTFDVSSWGYVRTDEGWELNACHYSTLTCCAVDHWGYGKYAYTLDGIGITLNSCGMEKGYGGALNVKGRTAVVFNAFNLAGGALPGADHYTGQDELADFGVTDFSVLDTDVSVIFNNCTFRQNYSPTGDLGDIENFPIRVKAGAKAVVNLSGEYAGYRPDLFKADLDGEIHVTEQEYKFAASYYNSDDTIVTNDAIYKFPLTTSYSSGNITVLNDEFNIPSTGKYKIDVDLVLSGTNLSYVYLLGSKLGSKVLENEIGTLNTGKNRLHYAVIVELRATEKLSFVLRTNVDSNVTLKKGSIFTITQL